MVRPIGVVLSLLVVLWSATWSATASAQRLPAADDPETIVRQLDFKSGLQPLGEVAEVNATSLAYLGPADARRLLEDAWDNPKGSASGVLGMLLPRDVDPLSPESWAIVVRYDKSGYVEDDDADAIDYAELLEAMREDVVDSNEERRKRGYPAIELVGWASTPYYDKATHKLHWAKELHFDGETGNTLNYNLRALGRNGVLELNFVAGMEQLDTIRRAIPRVMAEVNFKPGYRYEEFDSSVDAVAGYGLAALVAGGVLKKAGFFGAILAVLVAAKKLWIVAAVALFGGVSAFLRRRRARRPID